MWYNPRIDFALNVFSLVNRDYVHRSELAEKSELSRLLAMRGRLFLALLLPLIGGTILHSVLATRLDDYTLDEPYHIAAGVSYVQHGDFRLNPEHPPLIKLWVGSLLSVTGFRLSSLRQFHDKPDERRFTEDLVFLPNDPDSVQRHAHAAMCALNGLLLIALALALRRSFGPVVALGTMLFLAIDPTVAAHLPVVMTDLPVALLCATAVVLATRAFRAWSWPDLAFCSAALGLALGAKHSAPIFYVFVALTGRVLSLVLPAAQPRGTRFLRLAKLFCVVAGAVVILWSLYFFRFTESGTHNETFNRPLAAKIGDLSSPAYRFVLTQTAAAHLLPRDYVWGLADTVHAGLEGRAFHQLAFGHLYYSKAPWYFFPGVIAVKLPIGLILLALSGLFAFFTGRFPRDWNISAAVLLAGLLCFFFVLSRGATYAGVRHGLPAVPFLAVLAGMTAHIALTAKAKTPKILVALAFLAAALSALPVSRPWEYFNQTMGRARDAWFYFDDERSDMAQRGKELASSYHQLIQPSGDLPYITYNVGIPEREARGLDWLGHNLTRG